MQGHIKIGEIYREHGLKGLCKVYIYSGTDENLTEGQSYTLVSEGGQQQAAVVESYSPSQKFYLVKFDVFSGADQLLPWRKSEIWIEQDALVREEGEVFDFEWQGFQIYDAGGKLIGEIQEVVRNPLPQFVVLHAGEEVFVPWVKDWIVEHDPQAKKVVMELPEGLIE